jgi:hypothetical protein
MQPMLRLASRILNTRPPFLEAVARIEDCFSVPPERDPRQGLQTSLKNVLTSPPTETDPFINDRIFHETQFLRNNPRYPLYEVTMQALQRNLRIGLVANTIIDVWAFQAVGAENIRTWIIISADLIFPLLVPSYTKSEKMMASWILCATLLHEFSVRIDGPLASDTFDIL